MATRWRMVLLGTMGLCAAACGTSLVTCTAPRQNPATTAATEPEEEPAAQTRPVVVDVDRPWMKWGEARPDPGRGRSRNDTTDFWSDAKAVEHKVPMSASTTPAAREAIPRPVEPGSDISAPALPEPSDILKPDKR